MKRCYFLFLLFTCISYFPVFSQQKMADRFCQYLTGSYSSARQATGDSSYFSVQLHMYPIWKERSDARWFYVEQALASKPDKPYRQRVYRVSMNEKQQIVSAIYILPDPGRFTGSWNNDSLWNQFHPEELTLKSGCDVVLYWDKKKGFRGETADNGCPSEIRGASYATSHIQLGRKQLISWDRGYNAEGQQVWGAEKGGYRFDKIRR